MYRLEVTPATDTFIRENYLILMPDKCTGKNGPPATCKKSQQKSCHRVCCSQSHFGGAPWPCFLITGKILSIGSAWNVPTEIFFVQNKFLNFRCREPYCRTLANPELSRERGRFSSMGGPYPFVYSFPALLGTTTPVRCLAPKPEHSCWE